jgi:rod shape-determining protein MreD
LAGIGAVLALGAVAQVGLPAWSVLAQAKVQFLALIGLYYAVRHDSAAVPVCAFLAGLLHDSLSPVPLGHSSLILCLGCWLVGRQRQRLVWDRYRTQVLLGGLGTAVYSLALGLLLLAGRRIEYSVWQILVKAGATGLLGGLFAPGVFQVLAWCEVRVPWLLQEVRRACDCAVCPRPRG